MEVVHEYDLVIGNYQFQKKFQKKWSHQHPKYKTKRLLDYILISKRWKQILTDVESRFTSYKTDHKAIMGSIALKFKAQKKNIIKDKVSVDQHKIYEQQEEIHQILNNETVDANILWSEIKETINKCYIKVPKSKFTYLDGLMEKEKISSDKATVEAKILNIKKMEEASRNENQKEFYKAVNETIGVKSRHKNITSSQIISQIDDSNGIMEPETRSTFKKDR